MFTAQMSVVVRRPGITVERKHARTGWPLIQAKMMSVAFGGMRSPSRDALAMRAAACPRG
jgi:hypothetical protein